MNPYYEFLNGPGGCGKSYRIRELQAADPLYGMTSASTGIASVNMDCITINSLLGYFDTQSLRDAYIDGRLHRMMLKVFRSGYKNLIIDEISMVDGDQLDIIVDCIEHLQANVIPERQIGMIVVGDFGQLPVVKGKWAFQAQSWPKFEANTIKLTKNWRAANDPLFIEFLSRYRLGDGAGAVSLLADSLSADRMARLFASGLDTAFQGTSIMGTNSETSRFNQVVLNGIQGKAFVLTSERKGKQLTQWGQNSRTKEWGISPTMNLKIGAYCVIKANCYSEDREIIYANGDCGHVTAFDSDSVSIKLIRTGEIVEVEKITRYNLATDEPKFALPDNYVAKKDGFTKKWQIGEITYFPIKMASAATVHMTQSLTLDRVQIDMRKAFMGESGMMYVSLSRCRSLDGLRLVGSADLLKMRCKTDPRVLRFL